MNDSDDLSFCEKLVGWLIKKGKLPWKLGAFLAFLICGAGFWYLGFPETRQQNGNSVQSIEKIRSSAVNHMEKIYQFSKCETDWLYNINVSKVDFEDEQMSGGNVKQKRRAMLSWRKQQEGNLGQGISATKELLKEIERLSMQIADIWKPGVALGSRCIE